MKLAAWALLTLCALEVVESFVIPSPQAHYSTKSSIYAIEYDLSAEILTEAGSNALGAGMDIEALTGAAASLDISETAIGGATAALLAAAAFLTQGKKESATPKKAGGTKTKTTGPIDVSIPYDAAALLSYKEWCSQYDGADELDDEVFFPKYKSLYEELAVARVIRKRKQREFADLSKGMTPKAKQTDVPFYMKEA